MPEDDQSYDKENVNLWVDPERKDRWQAYLEEESEFQYLSQLIRRAVERQIQQSRDDSSVVELSENVADQFDDLRSGIDRVEQVMQEVEKRLSGLERGARDDPKVRQLANEVFEILPTKGDITDYEENISDGATLREIGATRADSGRVGPIAEMLEIREAKVRTALDRLQQDTHQVHTMEWDDQTRYYKEA